MTDIIYIYIYIYTKKADDLTPASVVTISVIFSRKLIKTLSKAIWNKAGFNSRDRHVS
jgi:hypothetical protein